MIKPSPSGFEPESIGPKPIALPGYAIGPFFCVLLFVI